MAQSSVTLATALVRSARPGEGEATDEVEAAADDPSVHKVLQEEHVALKDQLGVMGVPTFVIGEEIFWGNDRIPHLLAAARGEGPPP